MKLWLHLFRPPCSCDTLIAPKFLPLKAIFSRVVGNPVNSEKNPKIYVTNPPSFEYTAMYCISDCNWIVPFLYLYKMLTCIGMISDITKVLILLVILLHMFRAQMLFSSMTFIKQNRYLNKQA